MAQNALEILTRALGNNNFWTRIHSAEYLIELNQAQEEVNKFISDQVMLYENTPVQRIGVWRVVALNAKEHKDNVTYSDAVQKIKNVAFAEKPAFPDRIHALETLFKLQIECNENEAGKLEAILKGNEDSPSLRIYSAALLVNTKPRRFIHIESLWGELSENSMWRGVLLFLLGQFHELPPEMLGYCKQVYTNKENSVGERYAAALILIRNNRLKIQELPQKPEKMCGEWLRILLLYSSESLAFQRAKEELLKSPDVELSIFAAYATLKTTNKAR